MRSPDLTASNRAAWKVKKHDPPLRPDWAACVASWLVKFPGAHAAWDRWQVSVIHLRDIPGVAPAKVTLHGATHEFHILAVDPDCEPDVDAPDPNIRPLMPPDLVHQVAGISDRDAERICESMIRAIVLGGESPDGDYRSAWERKIDATVAHFRHGGHVES